MYRFFWCGLVSIVLISSLFGCKPLTPEEKAQREKQAAELQAEHEKQVAEREAEREKQAAERKAEREKQAAEKEEARQKKAAEMSFDNYIEFGDEWHRKKLKVKFNEIAEAETAREYSKALSKWVGKEVTGKLVFIQLQVARDGFQIHLGHAWVENGFATLFIGTCPKNLESQVSGLRLGDDVSIRAILVARKQLSITQIEKTP